MKAGAVKKLRKQMGLTQVEFAKLLKIGLRSLKRYEQEGISDERVANHVRYVTEREGVRV